MRFLSPAIPLCLAALAVAALAAAAPVRAAEDCTTVERLSSIDLTPLPGSARMLVPVVLNGAPRKLLLGTAGGMTTVNDATARALDLRFKGSDNRILDDAGWASNRYVRLDTFQMGNMHAAKADFFVTPDRKAGQNPPDDGIFAAGLRFHYDVEMDFAARKLNYFSPDHCEGHVVYWPASQVGVVPIMIRRRYDNRTRKGEVIQDPLLMLSGQGANGGWSDPFFSFTDFVIDGADIQAKVMLDGKTFTANIDTSLEYSTLNSNTARAVFDATEDAPGSAPATSLIANDPNRRQAATPVSETVTVFGAHTYEHTFHTMSLGGVTVINPHFLVQPDRTGDHDPANLALGNSHIYNLDDGVMPDISIGMDVLSKLHLYFAFQERKLYVTPAAGAQQDASNASGEP